MIRLLERIIEWRGKPLAIRCDNGPEYIGQTLKNWANQQQINLLYIQGKPTQNAYIVRFNRTARHEWLDLHLFGSIKQAQKLATEWLWRYYNERPYTAIRDILPNDYWKWLNPLLLTSVINGGIQVSFKTITYCKFK